MTYRLVVEGKKEVHIMKPKYCNHEKLYGCELPCCDGNISSSSNYYLVPDTIEIPFKRYINLEDFFTRNKDYKLFYDTEKKKIDISMFSVTNLPLKNYLSEHFINYDFDITNISIEKYNDVNPSDIEQIYMNINKLSYCSSITDIINREDLLSTIKKKKEYMKVLKSEYNSRLKEQTYGKNIMSFEDWVALCKDKNMDERKEISIVSV